MASTVYIRNLQQLLQKATTDAELFAAIVDAPFHDKVQATRFDLGIIVLLLVNKSTGLIDRVALSNTEQAEGAVKMSEKPFQEIKIPIGYVGNSIALAIQTGQPQFIADWKYLFMPALSPKAARFNQAGAGIEFSAIYPLKARDGGALIFSYYQVGGNVGDSHKQFMQTYADMVTERLMQRAPAPPGTDAP